MFKGEICIFLCLIRPSELLHHIAAPHAGCQSGGHLNAEKSRLSQTHPIPVESSSHVKGVFSCCLCAENDALGNMLLPMKSSFFLKHNILSHIMVLQKKKSFPPFYWPTKCKILLVFEKGLSILLPRRASCPGQASRYQ